MNLDIHKSLLGEDDDAYVQNSLPIDLLQFRNFSKKKVVDVGCGWGHAADVLKKQVEDTYYIAIEPSFTRSNFARNKADLVINDTLEGSLKKSVFSDVDCVIFADVLEHLIDPWGALSEVVKQVPIGCQFLIALPNVSHMSFVLNIAEHNWKYDKSGIFDITHLRFFTVRSSKELIRYAGLSIDHFEASVSRRHEDLYHKIKQMNQNFEFSNGNVSIVFSKKEDALAALASRILISAYKF